VELYNLYHLLNHANLFGGGYWQQSAASIEALLRHWS
jgi:fructosamine-3-kinase